MGILVFIFVFGIAFAFLPLMAGENAELWMWLCSPVGIALIVVGIKIVSARFKNETYKDIAHDNNVEFNVKTGELYLKKRGKENEAVIDMIELTPQLMNHHDASLQYTGVTVGAKTVGRVDVIPEHYSMSKSYNSGKYCLIYTFYTEAKMIQKIKLTSELQESAKNNPVVKKYLSGEYIIPQKGLKASDFARMALDAVGKPGDIRQDYAYNESVFRSIDRALEKEDAKEIINWIAGKN